MTTEIVFCERCQRILGVDCVCVTTRSLPVTVGIRSENGDSGDTALSPPAPGVTSSDLAAVTAVTHLSPALNGSPNRDRMPVTNPVTNDHEVSPFRPRHAADPPPRVTYWSAPKLLETDFPEPRWAVPGVIPEGVTLLAGAPKVGKSWLALGLCVAVASGGRALSTIDVEQGPVLYLALEDTPRRLQRRLRQVLAGAPPPADLKLAIECPPLPSGGLAKMHGFLDNLEQRGRPARLVVIDVFERVRGPAAPNQSAYAADYTAVRQIKGLADAYGVAVVLIHHVRKVGSADYLSEISGTLGLPGASDTIIILKRSRGDADGLLQITGRDVEENEYALRFDAQLGAWQLIGNAADLGVGDTRRKILDWVRSHEGDKPAQIALGTGLDRELVKQTVRRMADDSQLDTDGQGRYFTPKPVTPEDAS